MAGLAKLRAHGGEVAGLSTSSKIQEFDIGIVNGLALLLHSQKTVVRRTHM